MKKLLTILGLLILIAGCKKPVKENTEPVKENTSEIVSQKVERVKNPIPFFDFDAITYYHIDITAGQIADILDKEDMQAEDMQTEDDKILLNLLGEKPKKIDDTISLHQVEQYYPVKIDIKGDKINLFKDIFTEKYKEPDWGTACAANYRDILIFKKNGKVTGIANICFGCFLFNITGTNVNTKGFGQDGDMQKLHDLLKKELPKGSRLDFEG